MLLVSLSIFSQQQYLYKQVDTVDLYLETRFPENIDPEKDYPAIIFFFGGGWVNGNRYHFENHAEYFAKRGLKCFLADYRVFSKHQTPPFAALKDAKSAIRYLREHAAALGIDPNQIIAGGGSAGGHLAAATALIHDYNHLDDNLPYGSVPNALVLFNPVIDNGPGGYGFDRVGEQYKNFSPLHNIRTGAPPTILFLGTEAPPHSPRNGTILPKSNGKGG